MDLGRIIKWLVILAVVLVGWKFLAPYISTRNFTSSNPSKAEATDSPCVRAAEQASETWGGGIGRFANAGGDSTAWLTFRGMVDGKIGHAEGVCSCTAKSCDKARDAMSQLRGVVSDMDNAMRRNAAPPGDIVQRQEAIDNEINEARDLVKAGS